MREHFRFNNDFLRFGAALGLTGPLTMAHCGTWNARTMDITDCDKPRKAFRRRSDNTESGTLGDETWISSTVATIEI
jgi:hypothetical protein